MDAHHAEYAAAAAALHEQTPAPLPEFQVGQIVHGLSAGRPWTGEITGINGSRLDIEVVGAWLAVDAADVIRIEEPGRSPA